ncbi:MAG: hypothetical protein RO009_23155 [Pseudorhodoplanes sp.]|jgi:hypothetical protein|nr:hypothetical protein [Pseudorhodoplanes sp.]
MLRVKVELVPGGWEGGSREIARAEIGNISNLADMSDYAVRVSEGRNSVAGTEAWSCEGKIFAHDRRTSVWSLVAKVAHWAAQEAERS